MRKIIPKIIENINMKQEVFSFSETEGLHPLQF